MLGASLVALGLLVGCGGGESAGLTEDERLDIATFRADVSNTSLAGAAVGPVDAELYGALLDGSDTVIAIARDKPDAEYEGLTMPQVLADAAAELEPYEPEIAGRLDRAVATLE